MRLLDWMRENDVDDTAVAVAVGGITSHAVKKWKYGERLPRLPEMVAIERLTNGAVTANDFVSTPTEERVA